MSVVRGETPMSGSWSWYDRILAAAFREHRKGLCPGCGEPLEESTDKCNTGPFRTHEYKAVRFLKCYGCAATADAEGTVKKDKHPHLVRVGVTRHKIGDDD